MYAVISISTVEHKLSEEHIRLSEQGSFSNMLIVHILLGTIIIIRKVLYTLDK